MKITSILTVFLLLLSTSAFANKCKKYENKYNLAVDSLESHYDAVGEHIDNYNFEIQKKKPSKFKARLNLGKAILAYKRIYQSTGLGIQDGDIKYALNLIEIYCDISRTKLRSVRRDHKLQAYEAKQQIVELQSAKDNIAY